MIPRFRHVARLMAVAVVSATVLVVPEPAMAVTVPETMADRRPVQAGPVETAFPIDHLGVIWDTWDHVADEAHADAGPEPHGAVRFRAEGRWGPWVPLVGEGAEGEEGDGQWASGLVAGGNADAYQIRGVPAGARSARAVVINTTDGPAVKVGERRPGAASALASAQCRSRADWGADESLRSSSREYHPVQALTVHHTATSNGVKDPAATVRAIYRYHTVDQGWSDIGYQYLIDEQGVVYEGRWSGTTSTSCLNGGGDGFDFAHQRGTEAVVTGAHVGGFNHGNVGVGVLGRFTFESTLGGAPTPAAIKGLEDLLSELSTRHALDPRKTVDYVNPATGATRTVATISGHRDWNSTECPGDRLYSQLPTIRGRVVTVATTFADVLPGMQFSTEIGWLAARRISTGWVEPDGTRTYRPWQPVNRDAMAAFMYRLAGSPDYVAPKVSRFSDVGTDNQFYKEISWLAEQDISTGWPDGTFRPLEPVNRDAMAAFMYRFSRSPTFTAPATSPFGDVAPGVQFYAEMTWLAGRGISTGWPDGTFRPGLPVNRDAMAAFMYRLTNGPAN